MWPLISARPNMEITVVPQLPVDMLQITTYQFEKHVLNNKIAIIVGTKIFDISIGAPTFFECLNNLIIIYIYLSFLCNFYLNYFLLFV